MDMIPSHRFEPAAPLNIDPGPVVRPVHDEIRTIGIGQQDGFKNVLAGDC